MLTAAQHVYTNVEPAQSPSGRGGFQTLLASSSLSEADVEALEQRVSYVLPPGSGARPRKRVCFPMADGRVAVGQIVGLTERDASGRGGRSLAHTLVFDAQDFARAGGDPFGVFDAAEFFASVEEALAGADSATATLPDIEIELADGEAAMQRAMQRLPVSARRAVVALALAGEAAPVLALVGAPEAAEPVLRAALLPLTPQERAAFSFDTLFYRGRLAFTPYRAVALPEPPRGARFHVLDLSRLEDAALPETDGATPYATWADRRLAASDADLGALARDRADARSTSAFLLGKAEYVPSGPVAEEVADGAAEVVRRRLEAAAAAHLAPPLARRLASHSMAERTSAEHLSLLRGGLSRGEALGGLRAPYEAAAFAQPEPDEARALADILSATPEHPLAPWAALWAAEPDRLRHTLAAQPEDAYRAFLARAFAQNALRDPFEALVPARTDAFAEALRHLPEDDRPSVRDVARHLTDRDAAQHLDALTPYLDALAPRALRKLAGDTEALPQGAAPRFQTALAELVTALPSDALGARLRRLIGLPPKTE